MVKSLLYCSIAPYTPYRRILKFTDRKIEGKRRCKVALQISEASQVLMRVSCRCGRHMAHTLRMRSERVKCERLRSCESHDISRCRTIKVFFPERCRLIPGVLFFIIMIFFFFLCSYSYIFLFSLDFFSSCNSSSCNILQCSNYILVLFLFIYFFLLIFFTTNI